MGCSAAVGLPLVHVSHPRSWLSCSIMRRIVADDELRPRAAPSAATDHGCFAAFKALVLQDHVRATVFFGHLIVLLSLPIYVLMWFNLGARWVLVVQGFILMFSVLGIVLLFVGIEPGRVVMIDAVLGPICVITAHIMFGGIVQSGGFIATAYVCPLFLLLVSESSRGPIVLSLAIMVISLALLTVELTVGLQGLATEQVVLHERWYPLLLWSNVTFAVLPGFLAMAFGVVKLRRFQQSLHESKSKAEELNRSLLKERDKLQLERQLVQKLIHNVFPEDVSTALAELFEVFTDTMHCVDETQVLQAVESQCFSFRKLRDREPPMGPPTPVIQPDDIPTTDSVLVEEAAQLHPPRLGIPHAYAQISTDVVLVQSPRSPPLSDAPVPGPRSHIRLLVERSLAPKRRSDATILFADIVGFTLLSTKTDVGQLVHFLDEFFGNVDEVCTQQQVEKIKTIGDCYMCVGWTEPGAEPATAARRVLAVANQMHSIIRQVSLADWRLSLRAGIHCGEVISGIIGKTKFMFDVWGDAVNTASRMESTGTPGLTQVSDVVYEMLKEHAPFVCRGIKEVKGKGQMRTYTTAPPNPQGGPSEQAERDGSRIFNAVLLLARLIEEARVQRPPVGSAAGATVAWSLRSPQ